MSTRNWNIVIFFHFYKFFQNELFYLCRFYSNMATGKPTLTQDKITLVKFEVSINSVTCAVLLLLFCWAYWQKAQKKNWWW
jgi:hypothetical protein